MLEILDDKGIPPVHDLQSLLEDKSSTQEDFCEATSCVDLAEDLDCGNCIFSSLWCPRDFFEQWKKQKLEENE